MIHSRSSSSLKRKRLSSSSIVQAKRHCRRHLSTNHQYSRHDWSNMGVDLMEDIHKKFSLTDTLISRAVCNLWRSISMNHLPCSLYSTPSASLPPILWYGRDGGYWLLDMAAKAGRNLYLPANHEAKRLFRKPSIICVGSSSSHGYLSFQDETKKKRLYLLHPLLLSIFSVRIPPINGGLVKALLLSDPIISCNGIVAVDNVKRLVFAKSGANSKFSQLEGQDQYRCTQSPHMICINHCIYTIRGSAIDHYMEAWDCSTDDSCGPRKVMGFKPSFSSKDQTPTRRATLHLVESQGELWLVAIIRPYFGTPILTTQGRTCRVYMMDFKEKNWVRVNSLGDRVLIITEFQTMSISSKEFPQYERNSIYFAQYHIKRSLHGSCVGSLEHRIDANPVPIYHLVVFNMEDGSMKKLKTAVAPGYSLKS